MMRCALIGVLCALLLVLAPQTLALGEGTCGAQACAKGSAGGKPKLRVRTERSSRFAEDYPRRLTIFVTQRTGRTLRGIRVALIDGAGEIVASGKSGGGGSPVPVLLELRSPRLEPGTYTLKVSAKTDGFKGRRTKKSSIAFDSRSGAPPGPLYPLITSAPLGGPGSGAIVEQAMVDWRAGQFAGRDEDGFDAPGIGHGELRCSPDAQWLRFFPDDTSRETSMMNWTYKNWETWQENAIREVDAPTGAEFNEGLNKFGPSSEKVSRGYFVGIISDRLAPGAPGGPGRPPTTLRLSWSWDFTDPANARCFVTATFVTERSGEAGTQARSLTANWRGEADAVGHDQASVAMPGVGTFELSCEPGTAGRRLLRVIPEPGVTPATFTLFQGSDVDIGSQTIGPYQRQLPNNGMLTADLGGRGTMIVASRFKTNDPDPSQNFCHIAAQISAAPPG